MARRLRTTKSSIVPGRFEKLARWIRHIYMKTYLLRIDYEERHFLIHCLQGVIERLEAESGTIDQFERRKLLQKLVSLRSEE
jgi:hypothetical protein